MDILGNISPMLFRKFVNHYVPLLKETAKNCILNSPPSHLRDIRKERI
jgi:hypothetical protein